MMSVFISITHNYHSVNFNTMNSHISHKTILAGENK